jgi:CRISPR-associated protein Csy2
MSDDPAALLLLPRLKVQNANAISGPMSWGFPAPSAFTGFVHALSRRLPRALDMDIALDAVGIVCHEFEPQMAGGYVKSFRLTRNPNDENGDPPAFVEEGRTHFEVSLLIGVRGDVLRGDSELLSVAKRILSHAQGQRLAGGSILPTPDDFPHEPALKLLPEAREEMDAFYRKLRRRLLPGFALVGRDDKLQQRLHELRQTASDSTPLDALLDLCALHWDCDTTQNEKHEPATAWKIRPRRGWLVPVPVGYAGISPLYDASTVQNARDKTVPFRFVESIYSLGEWISPHRIDDPRRLLWHHQAEPDQGLYRCINTCFEAPSSIT